MGGADSDHWAANAADWIAWARTPGHDAYWAYRTAFAEFVGHGPGHAVDVGCGEGRVSRLLGELGWQVTAVDPVPAFIDAARAAGSAEAYCVAPSAALPLADASFDLALAYNMLMDVADPREAVGEMVRVLGPQGRLIVSIVHPMADFDLARSLTADAGQPDYFSRTPFDDTERRDGLTMHFKGWTMPLSGYADLLTEAGLVITRIAEPRPDPSAGWAGADTWSRQPLFLWIEARRV